MSSSYTPPSVISLGTPYNVVSNCNGNCGFTVPSTTRWALGNTYITTLGPPSTGSYGPGYGNTTYYLLDTGPIEWGLFTSVQNVIQMPIGATGSYLTEYEGNTWEANPPTLLISKQNKGYILQVGWATIYSEGGSDTNSTGIDYISGSQATTFTVNNIPPGNWVVFLSLPYDFIYQVNQAITVVTSQPPYYPIGTALPQFYAPPIISVQATAICDVALGSLYGITMTNSGAGYTSVPTVTITPNNVGQHPSVTTTVTMGSVNITLNAPLAGYVGISPIVTISAPPLTGWSFPSASTLVGSNNPLTFYYTNGGGNTYLTASWNMNNPTSSLLDGCGNELLGVGGNMVDIGYFSSDYPANYGPGGALSYSPYWADTNPYTCFCYYSNPLTIPTGSTGTFIFTANNLLPDFFAYAAILNQCFSGSCIFGFPGTSSF